MAYAALVFLEQELQQILSNRHDCVRVYGKEGLESLYSNVIFLEKFLEDFSGNSSSMIKELESQITEVAYEASDIIARGITHWRYRNTIKSCIKKVCSRVEDAKEIRKVLEMKKNILVHDSSSSSTVAVPSGKDTMVGLDKNLSQMKKLILGRNSELQIIPITGMGGIGKTTITKNIYQDPLIVAHFDVCSWVTVSQEHNTENILEEILGDKKDAEFLTEHEGDQVIKEKIGSLIVDVHKKLSGRRFLIVVDDIWSVEAWDNVRNAFPDDKKGSRIVITTRLTEVATKVCSSSPLHEMQLMNEVQSWELFQKEVFGDKEHCALPLEKVGKIISKNCKGLPLAIVVTGRHLKPNRTKDYWENFARNMNEVMAEATHDNQLMEILSLSYNNLPPHLKACFLYMSMFPEDTKIPSKRLILLWVAEGFLKPATNRSMEEVAEKCLLDLVERNLLFVDTWSSTGRIRTCTIHDALRELSLRKAKEDKFSQQIITRNTGKLTSLTMRFLRKHMPGFKDKISSDSQRTVYRRCIVLRLFGDDKTKCRYVYSLILHNNVDDEDLPPMIRLNLLRVLDVLGKSFRCLKLHGVNLRYLAITYSFGRDAFSADNDDYLFANIRKLKNLETLIIKNRNQFKIKYFPILEMPKLKHFVVQAPSNYYCLIDNHHRAMINSSSKKARFKPSQE